MENHKILEIINSMTIDEKIAQLFQINGAMFTDDAIISGPMAEMNLTEEIVINTGSILGISGAEKAMEIQKRHLEKNRHKIPLLICHDVIHGHRTTFPIPLALGCSWDFEAVKDVARISAIEASVSGIHCNFSPMVDLVRDPRWGRVMESTGEDPFLNGVMGRAFVEGYQGENLKENKKSMAACVKHFAAYGGAEGGRDYNTVDIGMATFYDMHLPAYKACLDAGAKMVMTAFNTIDGIPATVNRWLMKDVLRDELDFDGVLISDWGAIGETIAHGCSKDGKEAAYKAMKATVDIDMMSVEYLAHLKGLVEEGKIDIQEIDKAVYRVLELKNDLGLFENPYRGASVEDEKKLLLSQEHREKAREIAKKSMVLLKNEKNILPLKKSEKVAFVGPFVCNREIRGFWSDLGFDRDSITLEEGLVGNFKVDNFYIDGDYGVNFISQEKIEETVQKIKDYNKVVVALGEEQSHSGEGRCHAEIVLPGNQIEFLKALYKTGKEIVVILFNGRPLDLREVMENSHSVLEAWFPGVEGGNAVVDILFGKYNPSGKLTMSFPYSVGQIPIHYNHFSTGRPSDIPHAPYKSSYLDLPHWSMIPFGFGLSYTQFKYSQIELSKESLVKGESHDSIEVKVKVKNIGEVSGEEIVQMYIQDEFGSRVRPVKELKGFEKIFLNPGEEKEVKFEIVEEMLKFYTSEKKYEAEEGDFKVFVGENSMVKEYRRFFLK